MSRTYKHIKQVKLRKYYKERWDTERTAYEYMGRTYTWPLGKEGEFAEPVEFVLRKTWLKKPGVLTKKRKEVDTEDHWMGTPSWWNNLFHTRPIRGKFRNYSRNIVKSQIEDIEGTLEPEDSKCPHKYFW